MASPQQLKQQHRGTAARKEIRLKVSDFKNRRQLKQTFKDLLDAEKGSENAKNV